MSAHVPSAAGRDRPVRVLMVTGAYYPEISSGGVQCRNIAEQLRGRAAVAGWKFEIYGQGVLEDQVLARMGCWLMTRRPKVSPMPWPTVGIMRLALTRVAPK